MVAIVDVARRAAEHAINRHFADPARGTGACTNGNGDIRVDALVTESAVGDTLTVQGKSLKP